MDTHIREINGKRHINLTGGERTGLAANLQIERAIALFLDLEQDRTWKQIAEELGISVSELKRITKEPEFQRLYDTATVSIGHDPRLQAITSSLPDLLPTAFRQLRKLLTADETRDDVRLKVIIKIMEFNKVGEEQGVEDPRELSNFLNENNVRIEGDVVVNLGVPEEYRKAFQRFTGTDIVEGAIRNLDTEATPATPSVVPALPAELPAQET